MKAEQTKIKTIMVIYGIVISIIVVSHSFIEGYDFHLDYTISRYLGLMCWSAILFLITSIFSAAALFKFILRFKNRHKMNILWFITACLMLIGLLGLSICPIGLHDEVYGNFGTVSICHRYFSIVMFASSVVFAGLSFLKFKEKTTRLNLGTFVIYGSAVALLYATENPFLMDLIFLFEGIFLIWMMVVLLNLSKIKQN